MSAKLKRQITVVYRDGKQGWARRTLGHQHKNKGWFVLLLDAGHYRAVRPPADGFPACLCEDVGGPMVNFGRGGGRTFSWLTDSPQGSAVTRTSQRSSRPSSAPTSGRCTRTVAASPAIQEFETYLSSFLQSYLARELTGDHKRQLEQAVEARRRWASQRQQASHAQVKAQRDALNRDTEDLRREYYHPGDLYACPCGWRAKSTAAAHPNAREAERHWRSCQPGSRWKILDAGFHRASLAPMRDPAIQDRKAARAWERHQALRASMPASIIQCAHDLDGATAQKFPRAKGCNSTFFTCRRCGGSYVLASVWKLPCPAVPPAARPTCVDYERQCRDAGSAKSKKAMAVGAAQDSRPSSAKRVPKERFGSGSLKRRLTVKRDQPSKTRVLAPAAGS